ncbi:MAG: hypothetical protein GPJ50_03400 [Candidatus Heimdallarchaeota archaeon]|nr:hypothetical protein [Candidatus Heimdallarchaeota archaeon]
MTIHGEIKNVKVILEIPEDNLDYDSTLDYLLEKSNTWVSGKEIVSLSEDIIDLACEFFTAYLFRVRAETLSPTGEVSGTAIEYKQLALSVIEDGVKEGTKERDYNLKVVNAVGCT